MLQVKELKKFFPVKRGVLQRTVASVKAVDRVSFEIGPGRGLALVGESGSGKTTVGRCLVRLEEADSGEIVFNGKPLHGLNDREFQPYRRSLQYVFQDPYSSLNPRINIRSMLSEPLHVHTALTDKEIDERIAAVLEQTGLHNGMLQRYPHEFSGGQRQRLCLARALILEPDFLVLDEPVSSLDVSIQAQLINLLAELRHQKKLSWLYITHDLATVRYMAEEVAVIYLGRIVEQGPVEQLYRHPAHPYTRALLDSVPEPGKPLQILEGEIPSNIDVPSGCVFRSRCPLQKKTVCAEVHPELRREGGRRVACHLV